jgi:glycosyltransferase involved in cell wall biosynthesis
MKESITPLIVTFNDESNLPRALARLNWAKEIVIVDSFSTDDTVKIARAIPNVRLLQRRFDTAASQRNFGLSQIRTEWALSLEADHILSENVEQELESISASVDVCAYFANLRCCIFGKTLRAALDSPRAILFRVALCAYIDDGSALRLSIKGKTALLKHPVLRDDRKPLSAWVASSDADAKLEAAKLSGRSSLQVITAPIRVFLDTLFQKGLILDGPAGWFYVCQRTLAEILLSLRMLEMKLRS